MPNYNFLCEDCNKESELKLSMKQKENGEAKCPHCGSVKVKQVFSSVSVICSSQSSSSSHSAPQPSFCSHRGCGCSHAH